MAESALGSRECFFTNFAGFVTALILQQKFTGRNFARLWVILPWIVPTVVVVVIWSWLLTASGGIINYLLVSFGLLSQADRVFQYWRASVSSVIAINSWRWFPFVTVILLAALVRIPRELYEASAVDGASRWQQFIHITLPGLQPVLFVMGLVGTLLSFNVFDIIWLLTGGGPASGTTTLPVLIYDTAFKKYRLSQAAAMSVIVGIFLLIFAALFIHYMAPSLERRRYKMSGHVKRRLIIIALSSFSFAGGICAVLLDFLGID